MKKSVKPPVAPFDLGVYAVNQMTTDEKIALMKYISGVLGGPRFFTADEVKVFVQRALQEDWAKQQMQHEAANLMMKVMRK